MIFAIECHGLTKAFGTLTAVRGLNARVEQGSVVGFLGPNGAGKSTTIRMMLGLSVPTAGTVRVFGTRFVCAKFLQGCVCIVGRKVISDVHNRLIGCR